MLASLSSLTMIAACSAQPANPARRSGERACERRGRFYETLNTKKPAAIEIAARWA